MLMIAKNQLQSMPPWRKLKARLCLSSAKMKMRLVSGDRFVWRQGLLRVHQQVMMTDVRRIVAGAGDAHVAKPKANHHGATDSRAVRR